MPLAINSYLTTNPSLRSPIYYLTWGLYYASYALSPGLITVLQVLVLALTAGLPSLERATARFRIRLSNSEWASERFRDEFTGPHPPAEWPGWMAATGKALDVRWMGSSAWSGVSGAIKWIGGLFGGKKGAKGSALKLKVPAAPAPIPSRDFAAPSSAFTARPPAVRAPSLPVFAPAAPTGSPTMSAPSIARASSFGQALRGGGGASVRSRATQPWSAHGTAVAEGAAGVPMTSIGGRASSRASNPFSPRQAPQDEHGDDHGSVWSGSGWKKA